MTGEEGGKSSADSDELVAARESDELIAARESDEPVAARESDEPGAARETVTLNEADSLTAFAYLKEHPFMWWCGTAAYRLRKADREQGWIELGSMLGLSCEYHFFCLLLLALVTFTRKFG